MSRNCVGEKIKAFRKIMLFSREADHNHKKIIILGTIIGVLKESTSLARTFFSALVVNLIVNREMMPAALITACAISAILSIFDFIVEAYMRKISNLSVSSVSYKILSLNKKYMKMRYDKITHANAYNQYEQATDTIWEINDTEYIIFSHMLPKALCLTSLIGVFLNIDILAAIIVCFSAMLELFLGHKIENIEFEKRESVVESERKFSYLLSNLLDPIYCRDLQIYGSEKFFSHQIEKYRTQYLESIKEREKMKLRYQIISDINIYIRLFAVYLLALYKFISGILPIGNFVFYINASNSLFDTLQQIKNDFLFLNRVTHYYEDMQCFLTKNSIAKNISAEDDLSTNFSLDVDIPEIEFVNVSFSYPNQNKKVLENVSFKIYRNEKISLVGENGSGKTTIVKLLLKLYTPDDGKILFRGTDITNLEDEKYFNYFAPVFQDYQLLSYTIGENIAFDDHNREHILQIISKCKLLDKIAELNNGIDTYYTTRFDENGIEFSGGEQQLLILARALYKNSEILILDEPSSALDPLQEKCVFDLFSTNSEGKTTIFISHRMSASKIADRILVLKEGKICEFDSHSALIKKEGEYAKMWHFQSQWYI